MKRLTARIFNWWKYAAKVWIF